MRTYDIKIRFFGSAFQGQVYDLKVLRSLNENIKGLVQQMIAIHLGRHELAEQLKSQITQRSHINQGVFEIGVNFERNFYQQFGITGVNSSTSSFSESIARLFYNAIMLRRYVAEAKQHGKSTKILLNPNMGPGARSIVKTEKGNILLNNPNVLLAAQLTRSVTDAILAMIDGDHVTDFAVDGLQRPMVGQMDNAMIIGQSSADLVAVTRFRGRLDNLFFSQQRGIVIADSEVYQIAWDPAIKAKILNHADLDNVEFIAKPCVQTHSQFGELMVYQVLDCVARNEKYHSKQAVC